MNEHKGHCEVHKLVLDSAVTLEVLRMKDKCSNSVYHEHKDLLDDHDDILKQIKTFNASKEKLKNKVEREKEEDPSVEIFTIEENLKNYEIKFDSSSSKSCVKMVETRSKSFRGVTLVF